MQDCLRKYEVNLKSIKNDKSLIAYEKLFKFWFPDANVRKKPMKKRAADKSILAQFSIYELPKNVRKSLVFMAYRNRTLG